ncbi:DNA-binding protein [Rhodococcus erythropolis]|nr:DNA-binding protein [Rhodococcus erythropolis]
MGSSTQLATPAPLASSDDVATFLGCTRQRLAALRHQGRGPKFVKIGQRVAYRWSDVNSWVDAQTFEGTAQYSA